MKLLTLSTDEGKVRLHFELVVGNARLVLTAGGLLALYLDAAEPAHFAALAYLTLAAYLIASAVIALVLRNRTSLPRRVPTVLFAADVGFACALTTFTSGAGSPFFVFVWFAITAAAFRSGLRGAFSTAAIVLAFLIVQALLFPALYSTVSPNVIIVRAAYLGVVAFLLGYLAQRERDLRAEAVSVARILARAREQRTFAAGLEAAVAETTQIYDASGAFLGLTGSDGTRHGWTFQAHLRADAPAMQPIDVTTLEQDAYFFAVPPDVHAWFCWWDPAAGRSAEAVTVDLDGNRRRPPFQPPPAFWGMIGGDRALGAAQSFGDDWHMCLYLTAPSPRLSPPLMVHLLHTISQQIGPTMVNMYLLDQQTGTAERARFARELHDRVVQSLVGLEMQIAALTRRDPADAGFRERLRDLHVTLRGEIDNVRDLMSDLRPLRLSGEDLPLYLSDLAERFQRQTGIQATFASTVDTSTLTPRQCGVLARVVQEALVNIRKHSGAREAQVRLSHREAALTLTIEDNGSGFPFSGRFDDEQLWAEHKGPLVIKERARSIGASVSVDSTPSRGARLEVVIPHAL